MNFTYTEKYGDKPISEWLAVRVKGFVKEKYGLEIHITINSMDFNGHKSKIPPISNEQRE